MSVIASQAQGWELFGPHANPGMETKMACPPPTVPQPGLSAALTPGEATGHPTPYTPLLPGASSPQACSLALSPVLY